MLNVNNNRTHFNLNVMKQQWKDKMFNVLPDKLILNLKTGTGTCFPSYCLKVNGGQFFRSAGLIPALLLSSWSCWNTPLLSWTVEQLAPFSTMWIHLRGPEKPAVGFQRYRTLSVSVLVFVLTPCTFLHVLFKDVILRWRNLKHLGDCVFKKHSLNVWTVCPHVFLFFLWSCPDWASLEGNYGVLLNCSLQVDLKKARNPEQFTSPGTTSSQ